MTNTMLTDILRYIGIPIGEAKEELLNSIDEIYTLLEKIAKPRVIYQRLSIVKDNEKVIFDNTSLTITSKDLTKLFTHCESCYIMAVTLGQEVDKQIGIKQRIDMLDAVILDACASVLIEKVCDELEEELMKTLKDEEFFTMRFSPGYGDVPLETQHNVLDILHAEKRIGLTLTKTDIMLPTKSITAIIGISNQKENRQKSCGRCNLVKTCNYRRRGDRCGL